MNPTWLTLYRSGPTILLILSIFVATCSDQTFVHAYPVELSQVSQAPAPARSESQSPTQAGVAIRWQVPTTHLDAIRDDLQFRGDVTPEEPGPFAVRTAPVFFVLAGVVAVDYLAKAILRVYREVRWGGVVIRYVNNELVINNDHRIPSDVLLIFDDQGHEVTRLNNVSSSSDVTAALGQLLASRRSPSR